MSNKVKAATSRIKILESESRSIRTEFDQAKKTLIEKSETDDKYIKALRQELHRAQLELEKLKNMPAETVTRVIYKAPEELGGDQHRHNSLLNFSQDEGDEVAKVEQYKHSFGVRHRSKTTNCRRRTA